MKTAKTKRKAARRDARAVREEIDWKPLVRAAKDAATGLHGIAGELAGDHPEDAIAVERVFDAVDAYFERAPIPRVTLGDVLNTARLVLRAVERERCLPSGISDVVLSLVGRLWASTAASAGTPAIFGDVAGLCGHVFAARMTPSHVPSAIRSFVDGFHQGLGPCAPSSLNR